MNRPLNTETRAINGITVEPITPAERNQISSNTQSIQDNANDIATNTADINTNSTNISTLQTDLTNLQSTVTTNTNNIATKQDQITEDTDLDINLLSLGGTDDTPATTPSTRLTIDKSYASPQSGNTNGEGVNILFRFPNGISGKNAIPMGNLSCYFKSGSGTSAQYAGFKIDSRDNDSFPTLLDIYHVPPGDDGASVMVVGDSGSGKIECQTITLSGNITSELFLGNITGSSVGGYGFYRFEGNSGTIDLNSVLGSAVPWTAVHADTNTFTQPSAGSTDIQITNSGYYEASFNIYLTSTALRPNPTVRIRINGADTGYLAWSYIRNTNDHNESSWSLSPVILQLSANDVVTVQGRFTQNGNTGAAYLYKNSSSNNTAYPTFTIKRIA